MKELTCGIIIEVGNKILLGHSTGNNHWDIPKGLKEASELPINAAIRETFEETGLKINPVALKDLGEHVLNKKKNIHLYKIKLTQLNVSKLKCTSMVELPNRNPFPEIDDFKLFNKEEVINNVSKSLKNLLLKLDI